MRDDCVPDGNHELTADFATISALHEGLREAMDQIDAHIPCAATCGSSYWLLVEALTFDDSSQHRAPNMTALRGVMARLFGSLPDATLPLRLSEDAAHVAIGTLVWMSTLEAKSLSRTGRSGRFSPAAVAVAAQHAPLHRTEQSARQPAAQEAAAAATAA